MKSFQMELSLFIESYEYIDLKKGRKINFQRDPSKIEEIIFEDNEIEEDVTKIPVYSEIAAGMPIYINDEIEGSFYLGIGCLFLLYGLYRAIGKPAMSLVLTIISLGTRVLLAYIISSIVGVVGIWWSVPIGWFLADLFGFGYYILNKKKLLI